MYKLSVEVLFKILVERYLIEIVKNYNVFYEFDFVVMVEVFFGVEIDFIDVGFIDDVKKGGFGRGGSGGFIVLVGGFDGMVLMFMFMFMFMLFVNMFFLYLLLKGLLDFNGLLMGIY